MVILLTGDTKTSISTHVQWGLKKREKTISRETEQNNDNFLKRAGRS